MNVLLSMVVLILVSCGTKSGSDGGSAPAPTEAKQSVPPVSSSYYVASDSALIACDASSKGFLAYVQDKAQFMACLDAGWTVVNVSGKDGKNGSNGSNGKDGSMVSSNQWYDPISTKMWVMTNVATPVAGWNNSMSACTGTYRMPTPAEIPVALVHGLKVVAQALINPPTFILASDSGTYVINTGILGSNSTAAQFCISQ